MDIEGFFRRLPVQPNDKELFVETLNDFFNIHYSRKELDKHLKTISNTKKLIIKMFCSLDDRLDVCSFTPRKYYPDIAYLHQDTSNPRDRLLLDVLAYTHLPIKRVIELTKRDVIIMHNTYIDGILTPNFQFFGTEYIIPSLDTHGKVIEKETRNVKSFWNLCEKIVPIESGYGKMWEADIKFFSWE